MTTLLNELKKTGDEPRFSCKPRFDPGFLWLHVAARLCAKSIVLKGQDHPPVLHAHQDLPAAR